MGSEAMNYFELFQKARTPITVYIPYGSRFRKWAYDNAYTLVFLTVMFFITWIVSVAF
jgi:hypothetical protein